MRSNARRGQALFETAAFLPLILIAMLAIVYFSQYGVLQGRALQAVRYASLVTNAGAATQSADVYSLESMYGELWREGNLQQGTTNDPGFPSATFDCGSTGTHANAQAVLALTQSQARPAGAATASAAKFFQADTPPVGACTATAITLKSSATASVSNSYFMVELTNISAGKNVPSILSAMGIGTNKSAVLGASMGLTLPASPASMVYCSSAFAGAMDKSLTPQQPITVNGAPPAYGGYAVPATITASNC